jgi:hypothetical protein
MISGTRKTAFAALAPELCQVTPSSRFGLQAAGTRDPVLHLAQRFGPRRGLAVLQPKMPSSSFLAAARDTPAHPPVERAWAASIEVQAASAKPHKPTRSTSTHKL